LWAEPGVGSTGEVRLCAVGAPYRTEEGACSDCDCRNRRSCSDPHRWGNAVKDLEAGFSTYVAVRSANVRIFAERKATYMRTVQRQNT
jgi:hypothetical protein